MAYNNFSQEYLQEEQSDIKRFQQRFEAHITESREYRHNVRAPMDYMRFRATATYEMEHRVEPCVAIHLPKHQFNRLMDEQSRMDSLRDEANYAKTLLTKIRKDDQVRYDNPAVDKAYQKYLMLLELCR
jgi:hypothetical protein